MINKKYPGSYTVEMSLIMPMILGIILIIMYLCVYVHDKVVYDYAVIRAISRIEENNTSSAMRDIINETLAQGLIGSWNSEVEINEEDEKTLSISIKSKMFNSQGLLGRLIPEGLFSFESITNIERGHW